MPRSDQVRTERPSAVFRCDRCNAVAPAGTRETKIVVETRSRVYESRGGMTREMPRSRRPMGRRARRQSTFDKGGTGTEIVREISVCPRCAQEHQANVAAEQLAAEQTAAEAVVAVE